jgi:hypothetical protein
MGLPEGSGLFSTLYSNMLEEIKMNKFKAKDYGDAENMTAYEKKISFLNRYFVYKKFMEVNPEKVEIELGEYQETEIQRDASETKHAISIAKEETTKIKPKIRKLSKKLLLVPATEAFDEKIVSPALVEKEIKKSKKIKAKKEKEEKEESKKPLAKKRLIIENDEE